MRAQGGNQSVLPVLWGAWLFRHRSYALLPLAGLLTLVAVVSPRETGSLWAKWEQSLALILLALGEAVRLRVAGQAKSGTSGRGRHFRADELITGGLYAWTRNPLYLANLTIWAGVTLLTGSVLTLLILLTIVGLHYHLIIAAEERFLFQRHGELYRRYVASVPRLLPRLRWGDLRTHQQCVHNPAKFSWHRALVREHDTLFAVVAGAWLLLSLDMGTFSSIDDRMSIVWIALPACACLLWVVLKILRKMSRQNVRNEHRATEAPRYTENASCPIREEVS